MATYQFFNKKERIKSEDLAREIEKKILSYKGVILRSSVDVADGSKIRENEIPDDFFLNIPERLYEIPEHGALAIQITPDGGEKLRSIFGTPDSKKVIPSDGHCYFMGFSKDDEVFTNLKRELTELYDVVSEK